VITNGLGLRSVYDARGVTSGAMDMSSLGLMDILVLYF